ncbi:MAG: copper-binding protein [Acidobacteriota bacterium]
MNSVRLCGGTARFGAMVLAVAATPWILASCQDQGTGGTAEAAAPTQTAPSGDGSGAGESGLETYVVRGEVVELPHPGDPSSEFVMHHEPIDNFKGIDGQVWGMDSMTMPFTVSEDLSLEEIQVGDKVEFTLQVDWAGSPPQEVTRIHKLPADVKLVFRKARPPLAR